MFTPRIVCREPLRLTNIEIEVGDKEWAATPEYDALVQREWLAMSTQARYRIWDGVQYRVLNLDEWAQQPAGCTMRLGIVRYRYIATFRALHEDFARRRFEPLFHLSTVALVQTRDGHFVFGKRVENGAIDLIGGGVQPDEMAVKGGADLERNLLKEIREETGIGRDDIENLAGIGAVLSGTSNVLLVASAQCHLTRDEVGARFAQREDEEMAEAVFVPEAELREFLVGLEDYRRLIPELLVHSS